MKLRNSFTLPFFALTLFLLSGFSAGLNAQQDASEEYQILLHSGPEWLAENAADEILRPGLEAEELVNGRYYRIIQFFTLPNSRERSRMEEGGARFLGYLPKNAYLMSLPAGYDLQKLSEGGARAIARVKADYKIAPNLKTGAFEDFALKGDRVKVILQFFDDIDPSLGRQLVEQAGLSVFEARGKSNLVTILLEPADIEKVAGLPFVKFLERIPPPGMPEDDLGRGLHRSNVMDSEYAGGRKYTGEGVNVLVRDDGRVGPHIDYKGRLKDLAVGDGGIDHADGVAGVMGGAGNLNPRNRATAPGSFIYVINYANHFQDTTLGLHLFQDVKITNSSYSDGCNDGYTTAAQTVDQQIYENPTLMHVFSAGNSNGSNCGYGAGDQWGNITGGHKQAKNSIATGNLNSNGSLVGSSSRGPAHDGRIKPDICANGQDYVAAYPNNTYEPFGGTSGAAPGIVGTMATLYQAYRELNGGIDPESALIKACILNTATDLGNKGPDFRFGWGHVNARRAVEVLENGTWLDDEIDQAGANSHDIVLPDNVLELRIMLYWADPAAATMTNKALVNNLDLQVVTPSGDTELPLVLDPTPDPTLLNTEAVQGTDDLNNVEQVYLENPAAGTYQVEIAGAEVPMGPQKYYIVYEIITDEITVTYPIGGEGFEPFSQERIHWDAVGDSGDFTIEYTTDNGAGWTTIATVPGSDRMFMWNVPNEVSGQVRIRVSRDNVSDESEANFSIAYVPTNINIVQVCPDYVRIAWTPAPGANKYDIFVLGDRYMDSIGTSNTLIYDIPDPFPMDDEMWIAVRSVGNNGLRSRRSIAIPYSGLLQNCVQDHDLLSSEIDAGDLKGFLNGCDAISQEMTLTIENQGNLAASNFDVAFQINDAVPVVETFTGTLEAGESTDYLFTTPLSIDTSGFYQIKAWTNLADNDFAFNDTLSFEIEYLKYDIGNAVSSGYQEDFESGAFPPDLWLNLDPDEDGFGWEEGEVTGITGDETTVSWTNNFSFNGQGTEDILVTPLIDLTNANSPTLTFDYAYTFYNSGGSTFTDGLRVELSLDCGLTYSEVLFNKDGGDLATVPAVSNSYFPQSGDDWRTEFLDLSPYVGETVIARFINVNGWGNNLFLDNINVAEVTAPTAAIDASAEEVCDNLALTFLVDNVQDFTNYSWSYGPGTFPNTDNGPGPHDVQFLNVGQNTVTLIASNPAGADTAEVVVTVKPNPNADFSAEEIGPGEYSFTNLSTDADSYEWDFGDNSPASSEENPTHQYTENGAYTVSLTVTNDCGSETETLQLTVIVNSLEQITEVNSFQILPNPNNGQFQLVFGSSVSGEIRFELHDLQGRLVEGYPFVRETGSNQTVYAFNAQTLSEGVYLLKIINGEESDVRKIVIQR